MEEFGRLVVVKRIEGLETDISRKEFRDMLERWLVASANLNDPIDPVFGLDPEVDQKLIDEYHQKGGEDPDLLNEIFDLRADYLEDQLEIPFCVEETENQIKFISKELTWIKSISKNRLQLLRSMATSEQIHRMILRYECLLPRGQHFALHWRYLQYLNKELGANVEGFASPLNSQMLRLKIPNLELHTLFPDVDAPFQSVGSFFDGNYNGKTVYVNPPFLEELAERVTDKILETLSVADQPTLFILLFPYWEKPVPVALKKLKDFPFVDVKKLQFLDANRGDSIFTFNAGLRFIFAGYQRKVNLLKIKDDLINLFHRE